MGHYTNLGDNINLFSYIKYKLNNKHGICFYHLELFIQHMHRRCRYDSNQILLGKLHTDQSFMNRVILYQISIVVTLFRLIWPLMEYHYVSNQSVKCNYNPNLVDSQYSENVFLCVVSMCSKINKKLTIKTYST